MSNYEGLHSTNDYPQMRAYFIVMFGDDTVGLFDQIQRARRHEFPQDTVYMRTDGTPRLFSDPFFDNIREQMQAVIAKNGWDTPEQPPVTRTGDLESK